MGARAGTCQRPCACMDCARSLGQSRAATLEICSHRAVSHNPPPVKDQEGRHQNSYRGTPRGRTCGWKTKIRQQLSGIALVLNLFPFTAVFLPAGPAKFPEGKGQTCAIAITRSRSQQRSNAPMVGFDTAAWTGTTHSCAPLDDFLQRF
jgi:hypothetical protein